MDMPMDFSNYAGCFDDASITYSNDAFASLIAQDTSWPACTIDPSMFASTCSPLDGRNTSMSEETLPTPDSTNNYIAQSQPIAVDNVEDQLYQALQDDITQQLPVDGACCQPHPIPFPRFDSHQLSPPSDAPEQHISTSPPHRSRPPISPTPQLTTSPPPKRRGRPRLYPRSDVHEPSPTSSSFSSTNPAYNREQNRLAAQRFRARHDAYLADLNHHAAELSRKNAALKTRVAGLREEMLELKYDVLKHAECGCGVVDRYLEGNLGKILKEGEKNKGEDDGDGREERMTEREEDTVQVV